ncbi:MAG: hypothetical protein M3540_07850, partial [Actinomycetota bacterium]|nr:hypothetical protein [Actinomycetota bacterium]
MPRHLSRRAAGLLALVALTAGFSWVMQGTGFNQNSHYVLVKALAKGTPVIDSSLPEVGELGTQDVTTLHGNTYSNKAPGLAFATVPLYVVLERAGMRTTGDPTRMLWALGLFGVVLPSLLLLLLVRWVADELAPGFGTVAAVLLGTGTLLTPFATLFFSHALSALLVFATFAILFRARRDGCGLAWYLAAGVCAGLAVVTEYPNALAGAALGLYAVSRAPVIRRGAVYSAGCLAGVIPLALYNHWAFGSVTHISYAREPVAVDPAVVGAGGDTASAVDMAGSGHFQVVRLLETLVGAQGILVQAPVLIAGAVGIVMLARRRTAEALAFGAIAALYLFYNSSYQSNFGGFSPGQRYVIPIVPFLALGIAPAFRRWPLVTGGLGVVSSIFMVTMTATHALAGYDLDWFHRIGTRDFDYTVAWLFGITGWYTIVPFFAALAVAVTLAFAFAPRVSPGRLEPLAAGAAILGWAAIAAGAPQTTALSGRADELSA